MGAPGPLVSIVLPVYNGARYLRESLDSCLAQTYDAWELIAVDDASSDGTAAILREYARRDARVRTVRHERNRGLSGALNTGMGLARGQYLTWTSDDNRLKPHALGTLVEALAGDVVAVYSDYDLINAAGNPTRTVLVADPPMGIIRWQAGIASFLFCRSVWDSIGPYDTSLALAEDYDYWLRILAARLRVGVVRQSLFEYRRHAGSLTDRHTHARLQAAERALLARVADLSGREVVGQAWLFLAALAAWQGDRRKAAGYAARALPRIPVAASRELGQYFAKRIARQPSPV